MNAPTETRRIYGAKHCTVSFSTAFWERVDSGTLDPEKAAVLVQNAHRILERKWANVEYGLLAQQHKGDEIDLEIQHQSFKKILGQLEQLIQASGDQLDINATLPNDSRASLIDKALENKGRGEVWSGFSIVPLFELLHSHGVPFHEYMLSRVAFDTGPKARTSEVRTDTPHSILDRPMDPPELAYMLKHLPEIHTGFLADIVSQAFPNNERSQFFDDCIRVALQNGASLYEISAGWSSNALAMAEGIKNLDDNRQRNGTSRGKDAHALAMIGPTEELLKARKQEALAFSESFNRAPLPDKLTHETMLLLANIDELDVTLSTLRCDTSQAKAVLKEVATLPLFVIHRVPIAISRLERIAGEHLVTGVEYRGKATPPPERAVEGGGV